MNKKYELTDETINHYGTVLHRIKALRSFGDVKAGDIGGFVESEDNLSQEGNCWIYDDAIVKDKAKVLDIAEVKGNAQVLDHAIVTNGIIVGSTINGDAVVDKDVRLRDNAYISSTNDYISTTIDGIVIVTFYLSKDKDIYLTVRDHEYKLGTSYIVGLSDNTEFPLMVELAKKYLLEEREENE